MINAAQAYALQLLREKPRLRDIYEGADPSGKIGSGRFYVTYSDGKGPELSKRDVESLVAQGLIREKNHFPGFYEIAP